MAGFVVVHYMLKYRTLSLLKSVSKVDARGCDGQYLSRDYLPGSY